MTAASRRSKIGLQRLAFSSLTDTAFTKLRIGKGQEKFVIRSVVRMFDLISKHHSVVLSITLNRLKAEAKKASK